MTVRKWIDKRGGVRLPQDRLNSGMFSFFFLVPASSLVYGWCLQADKGGLPLPVIMAFFTAGGLLAAFAGVHAYPARIKCATLAWHAALEASRPAEASS